MWASAKAKEEWSGARARGGGRCSYGMRAGAASEPDMNPGSGRRICKRRGRVKLEHPTLLRRTELDVHALGEGLQSDAQRPFVAEASKRRCSRRSGASTGTGRRGGAISALSSRGRRWQRCRGRGGGGASVAAPSSQAHRIAVGVALDVPTRRQRPRRGHQHRHGPAAGV